MSKRRYIGAVYNDSSIMWTEDSASEIYQKVSEEEKSEHSDIKAIKSGDLLDKIREESSETSQGSQDNN